MAVKKCLISKTLSDDGEGNRSKTATTAHIVDPVVGGLVMLNYSGPKFEGYRVIKIIGDPSPDEIERAAYWDLKGFDTTPFGFMDDGRKPIALAPTSRPPREVAEEIADKLLNECRERKWEDAFYAEPEVREEWIEIVMAELQLLKSGQPPSSS